MWSCRQNRRRQVRKAASGRHGRGPKAFPAVQDRLGGQRMGRLLVMFVAVALSGCVTAQERQQQLAQQLAEMEDAKCKRYGAAPGTPAYIQYRTQLDAWLIQPPAIAAPAYTR